MLKPSKKTPVLPTLFRDLKPGELYVTGPGGSLYAKIDGNSARDAVTGRIVQTPHQRICPKAKPKDLRRNAKRLADEILFHS